MRKQSYFTHEGFSYFVQDMKQHPTLTKLWISKDGNTIVEVIAEEEDWLTVIIKDIKSSKSKNNAGYRLVGTRYGTKLVHRLVAETWINKPNDKNEVNHIDHNKENNSADNLEWVTREENMKDAWRSGCIANPSFKCRWRNGILYTKDKNMEMNYSDYLEWRESNGLPVYAKMRRKEILQ